jgi:bifunctional non-homologous end joining protein LigD
VRAETERVIDGRSIRLSNLEKVLYPAAGFTKAAVIDYYLRIAPVLLPHLNGRPITLKRYPDGVESQPFYEKNCPRFRPAWMKTAPVWSERKKGHTNYCLIDDVASLVWIANLATLEIHPSLSLATRLERPTAVAFDLDPGAPADVLTCGRVSLMLREIMDGHGLQSFAKTSGSKGLQVYVPLNSAVDYDRTKAFAHGVAEQLERQYPELVLSNMKKALRTGKVFVDWSQNDEHKTTVSVYSLRAREVPAVSTPVEWGEVERAVRTKKANLLQFTSAEVLDRVAEQGDLFLPVLKLRQTLPALH